jgi:predicted NUDIX family NTP pyrophosphohydrolase
MAKISAGLLLYRVRQGSLEVFLVHPGGPFWAKKEAGAWSIPKGEPVAGEALLAAAQREFREETGLGIAGDFRTLTPVRQPSGKVVHAWAVEADCDAAAIRSNSFEMEWPPHSGRTQAFPEVDRAAWLDLPTARTKITKGQLGLLDQLERLLRPDQ